MPAADGGLEAGVDDLAAVILPVGHPGIDAQAGDARHPQACVPDVPGAPPSEPTPLDAGYEPSQMLDVLVGIAQKTLSNYTHHLADTPVDEPMQGNAWTPPAA